MTSRILGIIVAGLGLTWVLFSDVAPIGGAFLMTGVAIVLLTIKTPSKGNQ